MNECLFVSTDPILCIEIYDADSVDSEKTDTDEEE